MNDIYTFYEEIKDIKYGWHDKNGIVHKCLSDGDFKRNYRMQEISDIKNIEYAICWEMCELERTYFKKNKIPHKVIFAILKKDKRYPCHTFLVFENNNKWYWFEASWQNKKGIHEYNNLKELLNDIKNNFYDFTKKNYNPDNILFYEYKKPKKKISCNFFYFHCLHAKKIKQL